MQYFLGCMLPHGTATVIAPRALVHTVLLVDSSWHHCKLLHGPLLVSIGLYSCLSAFDAV
jgi:hypothetical protein